MFCSLFFLFFDLLLVSMMCIMASPDANRLFEDLLGSYNKLSRPVKENIMAVEIQFKLKLLQILEVHEKNQMLTTNGWLKHIWHDYRLQWNPIDYGNLTVMHIPGQMLWLPDIILYNNAEGNPHVSQITKAHVYYSGYIDWEPPVIYNSMCDINIEYFPYDEQHCKMQFGSWTYDPSTLDIIYPKTDSFVESFDESNGTVWSADYGIDLNEYQDSDEWDLMSIPALRQSGIFEGKEYVTITYNITIRRKPLFYTINLTIPCMGITILTCLVFYLPSDGNNKIALSVSVLVTLTVFFLLLVEIIPPTSVKMPLIGRFLLFTMILVSLSVFITVIVINIHYRSGLVHPIPAWVRRVFIECLPLVLFVKRPPRDPNEEHDLKLFRKKLKYDKRLLKHMKNVEELVDEDQNETRLRHFKSIPIGLLKQRAYENVAYIAEYFKHKDWEDGLSQDWKFVALVIDRILLLVFSISIFIGTIVIFASSPTLYDSRRPITELLFKDSELCSKPPLYTSVPCH